MRGRIYSLVAGIIACGLIASVTTAAYAQVAPDPTKPVVLFDFEKDDLVANPMMEGVTFSHNTDTQYTTEGSKGSLKIDMTGIQDWHEFIELVLPEALDLSKHPIITFDLIVPDTSHPGENNDQWFNGGIIAKPTWGSGGDHDFKNGPQHLVQMIRDDARPNVTAISFYGNSGGPWMGPIYIDNIKALPGIGRGFSDKGDQVLIAGWNKDSDIETMIQDWPAEINKDEAFISEGNGSLALDLTDQSGWIDNKNEVRDIGPFDLSQMDQIRLDVYMPDESKADWQKFGMSLLMTNGEFWGYQHTLDPGWNTMIWNLKDLPEDQRENLKEVIGYRFRAQSGAPFAGPVYVDALRGSKEVAGLETAPPPPPGVKGDVNANGKLDISDVLLALQGVAGLKTLTADQTAAADINKNSKVDITDVVALLRAVAGITPLG